MYMLICRHRRKEVVQTTVTKQAYQSSQADVLQQPSQSSSNLDIMKIEYEYIMYGRDQKLPSSLQPSLSTLDLQTVHKVHKPNIKSSRTTSQAILITYPFLYHVGSPTAIKAFIFNIPTCSPISLSPLLREVHNRALANGLQLGCCELLVNFINFFDSYRTYVHMCT